MPRQSNLVSVKVTDNRGTRYETPFNLDLLILDDRAVRSMSKITTLDIYVGSTKTFHPEGLFSTQIFGQPGTPTRYSQFAYLDLKVPIMHPLIYRTIVQTRSFYEEVMARRAFARWDEELKDLVPSNVVDGRTGYAFFCEYLDRIEFKYNDSDQREERLNLLEKYKEDKYLTRALSNQGGGQYPPLKLSVHLMKLFKKQADW
jgi:hypothetical protein